MVDLMDLSELERRGLRFALELRGAEDGISLVGQFIGHENVLAEFFRECCGLVNVYPEGDGFAQEIFWLFWQ